MKKISALVFAVFMLVIVAVSAISAYYEDYPELDVRDMRRYGQDNTYLGDSPILVAPNIDGVVSPNEYQKEFVIYKDGDMKWEYVNNFLDADIHEFYAYDNDYFYIGLVLPSDDPRNYLQLNLTAVDSPSSACYTARTQLVFYDPDTMTSSWGADFTVDDAGEEFFVTQAGHQVTSRGVSINLGSESSWREGERIPAGTKLVLNTLSPSACTVESKYDSRNKALTYEIKVSKAGLAASWLTNGAIAEGDIYYIGIHYMFIQEYSATNYYSNNNMTEVTRKWYPHTNAVGDNAAWILEDAGLGGGTLVHYVFAHAEPEDYVDPDYDYYTTAPYYTTAAPQRTVLPTTAPVVTKTPTVTTKPCATTARVVGGNDIRTTSPVTTKDLEDDVDVTTKRSYKDKDDGNDQEVIWLQINCKTSLSASLLTVIPVIAGAVLLSVKRKDD